MIERVIENWLTRVNERSLETPFAQLLAGEGYQVVHLSRHGPFEEGKDILAIDPDGVPCAFQLKGNPNGRFTQKLWEKEREQIIRLVEIPIQHPSIDKQLLRRVYLVTNGDLDEEVRLEIEHRNQAWQQRGYPKLETIVKGQLLTRFKKLHSNLWPVELTSEKTLLEFFLADGTDCLQKGKLASFIIDLLPLSDKELNKAKFSRALASVALITAYALSSYTEQSNHVALIEGWTVYLAGLIALVEKCDLEDNYWQNSLTISIFAIEEAFTNLCKELRDRKNLIEGLPLVDSPFYRGRVTWLIGLVSTFALWKRLRDPTWKIENWYIDFVTTNRKDLLLWGEAAIPQFLATFWFLRQTTATSDVDGILATLIKSVCKVNEPEHPIGLPDPYHELGEVIANQYGISDDLNPENYRGRSYTLECLVHLFARRGWRQQLRFLWAQITRLHYAEFQPVLSWQYCLWASEEGKLLTVQPKMPQSWAELRDHSREVEVSGIPKLFQKFPELLLLFTVVYPHRLTKDVAKFLDDCFREIRLKG